MLESKEMKKEMSKKVAELMNEYYLITDIDDRHSPFIFCIAKDEFTTHEVNLNEEGCGYECDWDDIWEIEYANVYHYDRYIDIMINHHEFKKQTHEVLNDEYAKQIFREYLISENSGECVSQIDGVEYIFSSYASSGAFLFILEIKN